MAAKDNLKKCELDLINAEGILQSTRSDSSERTETALRGRNQTVCLSTL